jgi:hypothetical protein
MPPRCGVCVFVSFPQVNGTCSLLLKLIKFLPEAESVVLNALAFKQHILGMLADWVQITVPTEVAKSSGGTSLSLDALTPLLGVHTMFCQVKTRARPSPGLASAALNTMAMLFWLD